LPASSRLRRSTLHALPLIVQEIFRLDGPMVHNCCNEWKKCE
jgi:hypothetical protein